MEISYKKLWKLLIDKDMKKHDLIAEAHLDGTVPTALGRRLNEHSQRLLDAGIQYSTQRTDRVRTIYLERVAAG